MPEDDVVTRGRSSVADPAHDSVPPAGLSPGEKWSEDQALALKVWVVLARAHTAVQRHALADMTRHALTPGEFAILEVLYHKGPLLLGEVQRKILLSSGGVTYLVDRLEKSGLVERRDCKTDRRARFAALTDDGKRLMDRIFPDHVEAIDKAIRGLDTAERQAVIQLLRKLGLHAADIL